MTQDNKPEPKLISIEELCNDVHGLLLKSGYFELCNEYGNEIAIDKIFNEVKGWMKDQEAEGFIEPSYDAKISLMYFYRFLNEQMPEVLKSIVDTLAKEAKTKDSNG